MLKDQNRSQTPEKIAQDILIQYNKAKKVGIPNLSHEEITQLVLSVQASVTQVVRRDFPRISENQPPDNEERMRKIREFWNQHGENLYKLLFPIYQARLRTLAVLVQVYNAIYSQAVGYVVLKSRASVHSLLIHLEEMGLIPEDSVYDIREPKSYALAGVSGRYSMIESKDKLLEYLAADKEGLLSCMAVQNRSIPQNWKRFAIRWNKKNAKNKGVLLFEDYRSMCEFLLLPDAKLRTFLEAVELGLFGIYERDYKPRKSGMRMLNRGIPFASVSQLHSGPFSRFLRQRFPSVMARKKNMRDAFREVCMLWNTEKDEQNLSRAEIHGYTVPTVLRPPSESNISSWEQYYQQGNHLTVGTVFHTFGLEWRDGKLKKKESVKSKPRTMYVSGESLKFGVNPVRNEDHIFSLAAIQVDLSDFEQKKEKVIQAIIGEIHASMRNSGAFPDHIINKFYSYEKLSSLFLVSTKDTKVYLSFSMHAIKGLGEYYVQQIFSSITLEQFSRICFVAGAIFESQNPLPFFKKSIE